MSSEWAHVIAFEAQTRIFYALAGNVALRNCFNAQVFNAAVSDAPGEMAVPALDFEKPASYGSLELLQDSRSEKIGQDIDPHKMIKVPKVTLDGLRIPRLDLLKMDVEGMEGQVVKGAAGLIKKYRPVIQMEMIKDRFGGKELLLQMGYKEYAMAMNSLFVHSDDPVAKYIKVGAPEQRSLRDQARPGR
jgi:FkbM family methyltransferase